MGNVTLIFVLPLAATAAQAQVCRGEVFVNASGEAELRRLFPNATFHVIPDSPDPAKNSWSIVTAAAERIMSDAEENNLRQREGRRYGD